MKKNNKRRALKQVVGDFHMYCSVCGNFPCLSVLGVLCCLMTYLFTQRTSHTFLSPFEFCRATLGSFIGVLL